MDFPFIDSNSNFTISIKYISCETTLITISYISRLFHLQGFFRFVETHLHTLSFDSSLEGGGGNRLNEPKEKKKNWASITRKKTNEKEELMKYEKEWVRRSREAGGEIQKVK